MAAAADALTRINLDDLVSAFGWQEYPLPAGALRLLFNQPARKFARQMVEFDAAVGAHGLAEAARRLLRLYVRDVRVFGHAPEAPFLALSNHPGMTDTLALFAALGRADLKIIALDRPFLLSLPNVSRELFYVTDDPAERFGLVRRVSAHLREGCPVLTFPAGRTEPDPRVYPGALESLQAWTDSAGAFVRLVPETVVVPVLVSGVVWRKIARLPIVRLRKGRDEQELLASALQLLAMLMLDLRPVTVKVQIGRPISARELGTRDPQAIQGALMAGMTGLLENPPAREGWSAL